MGGGIGPQFLVAMDMSAIDPLLLKGDRIVSSQEFTSITTEDNVVPIIGEWR